MLAQVTSIAFWRAREHLFSLSVCSLSAMSYPWLPPWELYQKFQPGWTADYQLTYWRKVLTPQRVESDRVLAKRVAEYYEKSAKEAKRRKTNEDALDKWLVEGTVEALNHEKSYFKLLPCGRIVSQVAIENHCCYHMWH